MGQSSFLGRRARPVLNTNGARLASAIAVEKLDEFGNIVQPRRPHGQSRNTHVKRKRDAAKDVDTDVDDDNFVTSSSSDVGSSDGDDSEVGEIQVSNEEVRKPSTQMISEIY